MEKEEKGEVSVIFYECDACRAIFPHTEEQINSCPNCRGLLKKMENQDPN
ncbi:MAG: hypothetical protein ACXAB5_07165 [Candidatus Thorarchaeota archaeon]|jgi:rRNA maturation endonuclease Nob1